MFLNKEKEFLVSELRGYHLHRESSLVAIRHIFICTHLFCGKLHNRCKFIQSTL